MKTLERLAAAGDIPRRADFVFISMPFLFRRVFTPTEHTAIPLTPRFRLACFILPLRIETLRTLYHPYILAQPLHPPAQPGVSKPELMVCYPPEGHRDDVSVSEGSRFAQSGCNFRKKPEILRRFAPQNDTLRLSVSHRV